MGPCPIQTRARVRTLTWIFFAFASFLHFVIFWIILCLARDYQDYKLFFINIGTLATALIIIEGVGHLYNMILIQIISVVQFVLWWTENH